MIKNAMLVTAILAAIPATAFAQLDDPPAGGGAPAAPAGPVVVADATAPNGASPPIFKHGTFGLSFGVPTGGLTAPQIDLTYFADANTAYDLILGFNLGVTPDTPAIPPATMGTGGATTFGLALGAGYRMYRRHSARVSTYLEPGLLITDADLSQGDDFTLTVFGAMGVECMFADWFSIRGQIALSLTAADEFKAINLGTTTSGLLANFYWD